MIFKGPFQPKPVYDSVILKERCVKGHEILIVNDFNENDILWKNRASVK